MSNKETNFIELEGRESKCRVKIESYEIIIYMSVVSSERNGSYGNASLKLKKVFSVKIPMVMLVISFGRNGSYSNAALELKKFFSIKIPI